MKKGIFLSMSIFILGLTISSPFPSTAKSLPDSITYSAFDWQISNAQVVDPGKTMTNNKGTLTKGYIIEAAADAVSPDAPIKKGTLRITMSAFLPAKDMPGQKAGTWYVQGKWSITDENASETEKKARHSEGVVRGDLFATSNFNPCASQGALSARVLFPMSLNGRVWARGEGTFTGNEMFEGTIQMDAALWPDVAKIKGVKP
ncbi:MAG: hypothetical protein OEW04_00900 [Nitrospirota bacterium]|nr:hypothetical protein [Nitrospirota bacterium]